MKNKTKLELLLEGLDCANCATKIESKVNELPDVKVASLNFVTKTLAMEISSVSKAHAVIEDAKDIVRKYEPHVNVIEKNERGINRHIHKHEHCDGHCHEYTSGHSYGEEYNKKELIRLGIGAALFFTGLFFKFSDTIELALFFISYILVGGEVLIRAGRNILRGQIFDENFLMAIATVGAFVIGEFPEGAGVMIFYQTGELMQGLAVNRSRKSIADLMDIRPDYANLKIGNELKKVSPEEINIEDIIVVKPGEKVPLDGIVIEGASTLDTSALTGESIPRDVMVGSEILGGFINKNGLLTIKVTKDYSESTVSKILDLVQNSSSKKAPTEKFITKFARYYTPIVVFSAVALAVIPPLAIRGATFSDWLYRALIFLVVSCPCALVISIPLGFFGGIGGASKHGILVKGGNYLEALNNVDTVVFDKTGTLTKGVFKVTEIKAKNDMSKEELLEFAALAESYSNHPIAISILKEYGKEINKDDIESYDEISGYGIRAIVKGEEVLVGNDKLMKKENIKFDDIDIAGTVIHIVLDKEYAGYIVISDEIKPDSKEAIEKLKEIGVNKIAMLTGDNKNVASKVAENLGLDNVYTELLPHHKVEKIELLEKEKKSKGKLIFVGDGINDAPVLARADIGVAMGALGSDAAIEAADVVLMTDEPSKLVSAIKIAKKTKKIVWQNIVFALGVKIIVMILGAMGIANMWAAVFADVGVALIAVLNSMRALKA
ncbi:heavy metal translocating P-type ATPase [Paramaledivibacter caminithermalis]|jgi:Cd2+/Zn2+-exporting ATPase|uniref:Cd(2+)-exporting ATPase n=1 Tax=Paramaledivibacter caminithermalis (strain DSM 15212 / CIP 107654 / DViRD3) TaxID=1121301 RepID=A0A1M6K1M1_PARC5|nr:heavy metal translocating P-type ATPase [Paramaledivibacter caminithermalis]SHJ52866.1 Cd2+/Zn2+-exporting ATPase [Paramaledivibacter caminithermalis DSM 15212]